ncbi:MAG: hypothetical protein Q9202_004526 [Teloschistes flavicans]
MPRFANWTAARMMSPDRANTRQLAVFHGIHANVTTTRVLQNQAHVTRNYLDNAVTDLTITSLNKFWKHMFNYTFSATNTEQPHSAALQLTNSAKHANRFNDLSAVLCCIPLIYGNIPENDHLLRKAVLRYLEHHFMKNQRWDCFEAELSELFGNIEPFRIDADRAYMDGRLSLLHAGLSAMERHA